MLEKITIEIYNYVDFKENLSENTISKIDDLYKRRREIIEILSEWKISAEGKSFIERNNLLWNKKFSSIQNRDKVIIEKMKIIIFEYSRKIKNLNKQKALVIYSNDKQ